MRHLHFHLTWNVDGCGRAGAGDIGALNLKPQTAQVLVISVPSFAATKTAVLVNLRTLHARPIDFSCEAFE
jgi:hypothetical protein